MNYLNTVYPKSNQIPHKHYLILCKGGLIQRANTFDDLETLIQQLEWNGQIIKKAIVTEYGLPREFVIESAQERFNREEGFERCKRIAEELDAYADGYIHKCPHCEEVIEFPDGVGDKFKCPHCEEVNDSEDFEELSIYDYMDDILDIDFTVNRYKEYQSCSICIGWGGPNIYIDTDSAEVKLYWGSTRESYAFYYKTNDAINDWAEEYYNCL